MATNRETLLKFINAQSQRVQDDISQQGYKRNSPYVDRPQNVIKGQPGQPTQITMQGVDKTLMGIDEYGNKKIMHPGQEYEFPGSEVTETAIAKNGGTLLTKTITCQNCGWKWKAADGGNDIETCHKCGHENTIMQNGGEKQDVVNWTKKYISSPKYKERIINAGYDNPDKQIDKRLQNLENVNIVDANNVQGTVYKPNTNTIETSYPADIEYYNIHKNLYPTKPELNSVIAHELGHSETNRKNSATSLLNKRDREELKNRLRIGSDEDLEVYINGKLKHDKSKHNIIPEENKSDLNSFRYDLRNQYDAGNQDFTEEYLKNSPDSFAKERLLKNYSKEDLIWLMNNVAQNNSHNNQIPIAQVGGQKKPIYVESKNDPRYKAYSDSLYVHNDLENFNKVAAKIYNKNINKKISNEDANDQYEEAAYNADKTINIIKKRNFNIPVSIPHWNTVKSKDKYGNNNTYDVGYEENHFPKPQQPVIVKRPELQSIENTLQPIEIQNAGLNKETELPQIRQQVRQPKYYDVEDYTQGSTNYNGTQTNYRTDDLSTLSEQSPNNTRKVTPRYDAGGSTYQYSPVPITHGDMYDVDLTNEEDGGQQDIPAVNITPELNTIVQLANDNDKIEELMKITGKSKQSIQNSIINIFDNLNTI